MIKSILNSFIKKKKIFFFIFCCILILFCFNKKKPVYNYKKIIFEKKIEDYIIKIIIDKI